MNLTHLKYAVAVAENGSINKAAEKLYIGQPNLSRAVKELETSLGISVFERSAKGMELTSDGEVFIRYAKSILNQVDSLKRAFGPDSDGESRFSLTAPDSSYISEAFAALARAVPKEHASQIQYYTYVEPMQAVKSLSTRGCDLAVVRFPEEFNRYYKSVFEEKELNYELISEFCEVVLISNSHPQAALPEPDFAALSEMPEIFGDDFSVPVHEMRKPDDGISNHRIYAAGRECRLNLLSLNKTAFMLSEPCTGRTLKRYGLVSKASGEYGRRMRDVLVYRRNYRLTELDKYFISELCRIKRSIFD